MRTTHRHIAPSASRAFLGAVHIHDLHKDVVWQGPGDKLQSELGPTAGPFWRPQAISTGPLQGSITRFLVIMIIREKKKKKKNTGITILRRRGKDQKWSVVLPSSIAPLRCIVSLWLFGGMAFWQTAPFWRRKYALKGCANAEKGLCHCKLTNTPCFSATPRLVRFVRLAKLVSCC